MKKEIIEKWKNDTKFGFPTPSKIKLSSFKSRKIILCDTWIERERILNLLSGFKKVGSSFEYVIAPHIDFNPEKGDYQTIARYCFLLNEKYRVDKINSTQISSL